MHPSARFLFAVIALAWVPACNTTGVDQSGGGVDLAGRFPLQNRPVATACPSTRPPGPMIGAGGDCAKDSDCTDQTKGQNGRCVASRISGVCSYDTCSDDSACNGKVCLCRPAAETTASVQTNHCLAQGDCRVDSDCGPGGACSPSFSACGNYGGVASYYCHTQKDECLDDADCSRAPDGFSAGPGYCMYSPPGAKWICAYSQCAG